MEVAQSLAKRRQAEVSVPIAALHAVEERRELDELASRVHEVEVKHLLPCHAVTLEVPPQARKCRVLARAQYWIRDAFRILMDGVPNSRIPLDHPISREGWR
jgi:hypothetical protein